MSATWGIGRRKNSDFGSDEEGLGGCYGARNAVFGIGLLFVVGGRPGEVVPFGGVDGAAAEVVGPGDAEAGVGLW